MLQFSPELTRTLRAALDDAAVQLQSDSSTKAFMAEQILRAAADGIHRREELTDIAIKAARANNLRRTHPPTDSMWRQTCRFIAFVISPSWSVFEESAAAATITNDPGNVTYRERILATFKCYLQMIVFVGLSPAFLAVPTGNLVARHRVLSVS